MAETGDAKSAAEAHVTAAIDSTRRFPDNPFRGAWHCFLFFDSDLVLLVPEAVYRVHALLEADRSACAVLCEFDEAGDGGGARFRRYVHREEVPRPNHDLLHSEPQDPVRSLRRFGMASDSGRWCMYLEGREELGVLAVRDQPLRALLEPAVRLLDAQTIDQALKKPHCYTLEKALPSFKSRLHGAFGDRARADGPRS